jgi:hypothetical protein
MSRSAMQPHTRAIAAASAHALASGKKVAGLYDHATQRHLRIAAEARAGHVQGFDGDRDAKFGGILPELRDASDGASLHMEVAGNTARGYDRSTSGHFTVEVAERLVQLYDHAEAAWFTFDVQVA